MTDSSTDPSSTRSASSTTAAHSSAVEIGRRRSLSRSSQRSGLRSSLGGKPVIPIYSTSAAAAAPSESAISDSDAGSMEEAQIRARIGSFSATREEIRDGQFKHSSSISLGRLRNISLPPCHGHVPA